MNKYETNPTIVAEAPQVAYYQQPQYFPYIPQQPLYIPQQPQYFPQQPQNIPLQP